MKFNNLVFAVLLLVFVVLANVPSSAGTKLIYQNKYLLAKSSYIDFKDDGWYLDFYFVSSYLSLNMRRRRPVEGFVVETVQPKNEKTFDCRRESAVWLQELMFNCRGNVLARNLTKEENDEMQTFIHNPKGTRKDFQMVYDRYPTIRAASAYKIFVDAYSDRYMATVQARTRWSEQYALIHGYDGKSFVMEEERGSNGCGATPIEGLTVSEGGFCKGEFRIRPMTDEDKPLA